MQILAARTCRAACLLTLLSGCATPIEIPLADGAPQVGDDGGYTARSDAGARDAAAPLSDVAPVLDAPIPGAPDATASPSPKAGGRPRRDGGGDAGVLDGAMDDGAMDDGAMDDGAMDDGAMDDGAMEDGVAQPTVQ